MIFSIAATTLKDMIHSEKRSLSEHLNLLFVFVTEVSCLREGVEKPASRAGSSKDYCKVVNPHPHQPGRVNRRSFIRANKINSVFAAVCHPCWLCVLACLLLCEREHKNSCFLQNAICSKVSERQLLTNQKQVAVLGWLCVRSENTSRPDQPHSPNANNSSDQTRKVSIDSI